MLEKKQVDFNINKDKTINQLLDKPIPRPPDFESHLVKRCYDLANKKLKFFMPEDLRIMIGQNIGLDFLMPLAVEFLQKGPFVEAEFFEGDLFLKVLNIDSSFWDDNSDLKENVITIFKTNLSDFKNLDLDTQEELYEAYEKL